MRTSLPDLHVDLWISGDLLTYFLPAYTYLAERLRAHELPLWNPWQAAGQPFLATWQPGVFYPGRLLLLVCDVPNAMRWSTVGHIHLVVLATYGLLRALATRPGAAAAGAVVFGATFALPNMFWPVYLEAGAWLPLIALLVVRIAGGAGWPWVVGLGLASAMPVLAGGYQVTIYVVYAIGIFGLALLTDRRRCPAPVATLGRLTVAGLLAVATAAPQLLVTLAWASEVSRRPVALSDVQLDPFAGGGSWVLNEVLVRRAGWFQPFYLSVPVAVLALVGFVTAGVFGVVLATGTLVAYLLALGPGTPWFWLYRWVPGLAMYRFPMRLFTIVAFLCAIGTALAVDRLAAWIAVARPRCAVGLEFGVVALLVVVLVWPIRNETALPWTVGPEILAPPAELVSVLRGAAGDGRVMLPENGAPRLALRQGMVQHIRVVQDYEPLSSRRLADFLYAVVGQPPPGPEAALQFLGVSPGRRVPILHRELLDLLAVRALVGGDRGPPPGDSEPLRALPVSGSAVYLNPYALPRTYLLDRVQYVADERTALAALTSGWVDPRREAVVVGAPAGPAEAALADAPRALYRLARLAVDTPERVEVAVETDRPALLVLADAFAPGWGVTVDGEQRPLLQVNHLVRGVVVHSGARRVEFRYGAPGLREGLTVALLAWAAVGGATLAVRLRRGGSAPRLR